MFGWCLTFDAVFLSDRAVDDNNRQNVKKLKPLVPKSFFVVGKLLFESVWFLP